MERDTPQRRAIRQVFSDSGRPLRPDEVLEAAQRLVKGLGIATVYRNLKTMTENGWLRAVDLPGDATRYEVAGKPHHHHFLCRKCDRAFEVDGCPDNLGVGVPPGFRLEQHEVVLYGLCAACVH